MSKEKAVAPSWVLSATLALFAVVSVTVLITHNRNLFLVALMLMVVTVVLRLYERRRGSSGQL